MESAWTHSEMCRFRVIDPLAFDNDLPVAAADFDGDKKAVFAHRTFVSSPFLTTKNFLEFKNLT